MLPRIPRYSQPLNRVEEARERGAQRIVPERRAVAHIVLLGS